jgi:hypothetical protein
MKLRADLVDRCDARLIDARNAERRRISRTQLVEAALTRILALNDHDFERALVAAEN